MTQPRSHCKALQSPRPFRFWNTTPDAGGREQSRHESETAQPFPSCWITCIGIGSPAHPCTFISTAFNASGSSKTSIIKERKTIEREPTVDGQRSQEHLHKRRGGLLFTVGKPAILQRSRTVLTPGLPSMIANCWPKRKPKQGNKSPANSNSNMQATPTPERNHPAHTFKDARPREACSRTPSET